MVDKPPLPDTVVDMLNATLGGFNLAIGLRFTKVTYDEVSAELDIKEHHHQPYGLVHGGIYAAMIETLASAGAAVNAMASGQHTVGLENSTSFLRAVRQGVLRATGVPLTRGRKTQVWQVTVCDSDGRPAAQGRVRLLNVEHGTAIAGETVGLPGGRLPGAT